MKLKCDVMADTQNIEAKLAAYVDGDIDPAERAEIEQHLAANPEHRQMIDQLTAQRHMLRALPREAAPADVAEALAQQLERAVLLGDVDIGADTRRAVRNRVVEAIRQAGSDRNNDTVSSPTFDVRALHGEREAVLVRDTGGDGELVRLRRQHRRDALDGCGHTHGGGDCAALYNRLDVAIGIALRGRWRDRNTANGRVQ